MRIGDFSSAPPNGNVRADVATQEVQSTVLDVADGGQKPSVIVDISGAAQAPEIIDTQLQQTPVTTVPDVVIEYIQVSANSFAQSLIAQYQPNIPDYGAVARAVNQFYSSQYALAGESIAFVDSRLEIDPEVMEDPVLAERATQTRDELIALVYRAKAYPSENVNGPGSTDITGAELLARLDKVDFRILPGIGSPQPTADFTPNSAWDGGTIRIYPASFDTFYAGTGMSLIGQTATTVFHEIGHALLVSEFQASWTAFYNSSIASGMAPADIPIAYNLQDDARRAEEARATAIGHGAAELAGYGSNFNGGILRGGEAPR